MPITINIKDTTSLVGTFIAVWISRVECDWPPAIFVWANTKTIPKNRDLGHFSQDKGPLWARKSTERTLIDNFDRLSYPLSAFQPPKWEFFGHSSCLRRFSPRSVLLGRRKSSANLRWKSKPKCWSKWEHPISYVDAGEIKKILFTTQRCPKVMTN